MGVNISNEGRQLISWAVEHSSVLIVSAIGVVLLLYLLKLRKAAKVMVVVSLLGALVISQANNIITASSLDVINASEIDGTSMAEVMKDLDGQENLVDKDNTSLSSESNTSEVTTTEEPETQSVEKVVEDKDQEAFAEAVKADEAKKHRAELTTSNAILLGEDKEDEVEVKLDEAEIRRYLRKIDKYCADIRTGDLNLLINKTLHNMIQDGAELKDSLYSAAEDLNLDTAEFDDFLEDLHLTDIHLDRLNDTDYLVNRFMTPQMTMEELFDAICDHINIFKALGIVED